ncbi:hypothetical protein NSERUTF1_2327 [Nocardia seriolae]|nr:hypothetical protein NSERUTF1_2327 [Nocardia seriolae]
MRGAGHEDERTEEQRGRARGPRAERGTGGPVVGRPHVLPVPFTRLLVITRTADPSGIDQNRRDRGIRRPAGPASIDATR